MGLARGGMKASRAGSPYGVSLNGHESQRSGWLFVLPWSLRETGGVNEAVKSLIRRFQAASIFTPYVLISSQEHCSDAAGLAIDEPQCLSLWTQRGQHHRLRTALSFFLQFPARCRKIRQVVERFNISVINAHYPNLGALNFLAMKKLGLFRGKLLLSFHLSDVIAAVSTRGIKRFLWRMLVRGADGIVVVSKDMAMEILALEPRAARSLRTIYNGVDLDLFASARRDHEKEQQVSTVGGHDILSVGNFVARKGHDVLVRAFAHVVKEVPDVHLTLLGGDGSEFGRIHELVDSLSLSRKVSIIKDVPHERIPEFLSRASLFALASRREGFALVALEAAAAKVPIVCTRVSGLRDLITDGVTGRLVDVGDALKLAEAIISLLRNPREARKLANNLYEEVERKFTWQNAYQRYLDVAANNNELLQESLQTRD